MLSCNTWETTNDLAIFFLALILILTPSLTSRQKITLSSFHSFFETNLHFSNLRRFMLIHPILTKIIPLTNC